jgi:hypothetical protein
MSDDQSQGPKPELIAETSVRIGSAAITSFIPGGAIVHECIMTLLSHHQNKKSRAWLEDLDKRLSDRLAAVEARTDPGRQVEVITAVVEQAFHSARRTFQDEKLEMLKVAVLNTAASTASEDDIALFMGLVDELTVPHIKVLRELADFERLKQAWRANARQGNAIVQQPPNPELGWVFERVGEAYKDPERCSKIAFDLYTRGLIYMRNAIAPTTIQREQVSELTATKFGRAFIRFLTADAPGAKGPG